MLRLNLLVFTILLIFCCKAEVQLTNSANENVEGRMSKSSGYLAIFKCATNLDLSCFLDKTEDVLLEANQNILGKIALRKFISFSFSN